MAQIRAGITQLQINGEIYDVVGNVTYNLGREILEELVGADRFHGFKVRPQAPMMELEIRDRGTLDVARLLALRDGTLALSLANGKVIVLRDASFAGEGGISTEEATIQARFVGSSGEEVR